MHQGCERGDEVAQKENRTSVKDKLSFHVMDTHYGLGRCLGFYGSPQRQHQMFTHSMQPIGPSLSFRSQLSIANSHGVSHTHALCELAALRASSFYPFTAASTPV